MLWVNGHWQDTDKKFNGGGTIWVRFGERAWLHTIINYMGKE